MSSKSKGDAGEYEFTRAAYDELKDAEHRFGLEFVQHLTTTDRRGVWNLTVVAWQPSPDGQDRRVASYGSDWPNSTVQSFGAFLYGACHRLVRMVEQAANEKL